MTQGKEIVSPADPQPFYERAILALLAVYFLGRLLILATTIAPGVPPDEMTHVGISQLYSESWLSIEDSPASYSHGLVTRVPYLYHLLMGKLLALNVFKADTYQYLRLWNVLLSMATLVVAFRLAQLLSRDWRVRVLFVVLATNTLMLTFLSASVTYDNLVNLLAVSSVYFLISFFVSGRRMMLLGFLLALLLGALTKVTFLPLALLLVALLVVERRKSLAEDGRQLVKLLTGRRPALWAVATMVLVAGLLNVSLYGTNLLRHGRVVPSCSQVLGVETCMQNRIFARNWIVGEYRLNRLTFEEAVQQTVRIGHAGDRDHALRLLNHERWYKSEQPETLNVIDYIRQVWTQAMRPSIFGIQAHVSMLKSPNDLMPYSLIFLAGFVLWVRRFSLRGPERMWGYLALVSILYFLFLVGWVNYRGYLGSHAPFLGVQGRYVFPVILPAFLVLARSLLGAFGWRVRTAVLVIVTTVFVLGDYPYFRRHTSPAWFAATGSAAVEAPGSP